MYKEYVKRTPLRAVRFKDDYETYVFICKELGEIFYSEEEYHQRKKYGINLHSKESRQVLFIGDYLANAGDGDFYVIRKEFMEEHYKTIDRNDVIESNKPHLIPFDNFMDLTKRIINKPVEDGLILHLDFTNKNSGSLLPSRVLYAGSILPVWGDDGTLKEYKHELGDFVSTVAKIKEVIEDNRKELEEYKKKEGK